jgi:hypothetical protein
MPTNIPPVEWNEYTLCPYCGETHHEDESHECDE